MIVSWAGSWLVWLAVPVAATTLAALWTWWRGSRARKARRPLGTEAAVRAHSQYLDALVVPARSADRGRGRGSDPSAPSDSAGA